MIEIPIIDSDVDVAATLECGLRMGFTSRHSYPTRTPPWWTQPGCQVFLGLNGEWVSANEDDRFDLMIDVASGAIDDVHRIAELLRMWCD